MDFDREVMYIIDGHTNKIISCSLDGQNVNTVLYDPSEIKHPFALAMVKVCIIYFVCCISDF